MLITHNLIITLFWISVLVLLASLYEIFVLKLLSVSTGFLILLVSVTGIFLSQLYLNQEQAPMTPSTSFAQTNTAVLATVKEGDLILCTDPASDKVQSAFLLRSIFPVRFSGVSFHGILINRNTASAVDVFSSYFDRCRFEVLRDDGLGNVDQKIGKIIRFGLNPPPPPK